MKLKLKKKKWTVIKKEKLKRTGLKVPTNLPNICQIFRNLLNAYQS